MRRQRSGGGGTLPGAGVRRRPLLSGAASRTRSSPRPAAGRVDVRIAHLGDPPDRPPAGDAGRVRHPRPEHDRQPHPARQQPRRRALQRRDLGADRDRLHDGLRDRRADQLRPRRGLHDRLAGRLRVLEHDRRRPRHGRPAADPRPRPDPDHRLGGERRPRGDDRARRLPPAPRRAEAGAADHRGRLLVHPPERRPAVDRRLAEERPGSDRVAGHAASPSAGSRSPTATRSRCWRRCRSSSR